MPVYEYRCTSCGRTFSTLVRRISESPATAPACPACGGASERALSGFAYHKSLKTKIEQIDPQIEKELDYVDNVKGDDPLSRLNLNFPSTPT